jgi:hypothetical protein
LVEVEKKTFQGVVWTYTLIFSLVAGLKCDLGEVEKAKF